MYYLSCSSSVLKKPTELPSYSTWLSDIWLNHKLICRQIFSAYRRTFTLSTITVQTITVGIILVIVLVFWRSETFRSLVSVALARLRPTDGMCKTLIITGLVHDVNCLGGNAAFIAINVRPTAKRLHETRAVISHPVPVSINQVFNVNDG